MDKKKIFLHYDKLDRLYGLSYSMKDSATPDELKETLNMFRGQQKSKGTYRSVIKYALLSLKGDKEALTNYHYGINNSWRYDEEKK